MPTARRSILAKPLILCVNNDPTELGLQKVSLEEGGFTVLSATNAADAVLTLLEAPISCTVADHIPHGHTGTELAKELKSVKPNVPFILYSGMMPSSLQNIDVYIYKDEPKTAFLRIVREVIERFAP